MPLYEYECEACGRRFEIIQKFSDPAEACKLCGKGPVQRLLSSPAIQFKGTGWYVTDYAQKGKSDSSSAAPAGKTDTKSDGSSDSASAKSDTTKSDTTKRDSGATAAKTTESKE